MEIRSPAMDVPGHPSYEVGNGKTLLLAEAVMDFHFAFAAGNRHEALVRLHRSELRVRGVVANAGDYTTHVTASDLDDGQWWPQIIAFDQALKVFPVRAPRTG